MTVHELKPGRQTVHGYFSCELEPVLTIIPGDTVVYETMEAGWHLPPDPETKLWERKQVNWYDAESDTGHALNGPVAIKGAGPGTTLEVEILEVRPGTWGWSVAGGWESETNEGLGLSDGEILGNQWSIDADQGLAARKDGCSLPIRPFLGVMGMPPPEPGRHATGPPRIWGGNIDCKELVAGATLFLPISVPDGMFSCGDGHAVQGDGEVSGVAIECPMERVVLKFNIRSDLALSAPRALTPSGWITFGFDEDLDRAAVMATSGMLDLMGDLQGLSRRQALNLASLMVDLRVTQIVNGTKGVHAVLPTDAVNRLR